MGKRSASGIAKPCMALTCRMAAGCQFRACRLVQALAVVTCSTTHAQPTRGHAEFPTPNAQPTLNLLDAGNSTGLALPMHLYMETTDWNPKKPYDLRERLFEFGCLFDWCSICTLAGLWR